MDILLKKSQRHQLASITSLHSKWLFYYSDSIAVWRNRKCWEQSDHSTCPQKGRETPTIKPLKNRLLENESPWKCCWGEVYLMCNLGWICRWWFCGLMLFVTQLSITPKSWTLDLSTTNHINHRRRPACDLLQQSTSITTRNDLPKRSLR